MSRIVSAGRNAARLVLLFGGAAQLACSNGSVDTNASAPPASTTDGGAPPASITPGQPPVIPPARRGMVEIDQMTGTRPVQLQQQLAGDSVSLSGIYQQAGFPLRVVADQRDLPRMEKVRLADLHGFMTTYRTVAAQAGEWRFYALVVTEDADDPGTLGIMFDFGAQDANDLPREAFAVFATAHESLSTPADPELLLTTAHELAHCFNLHHPDWEGGTFRNGSTIESYSMTNDCIWALSSRSRQHILNGPATLVMPGQGGLSFGLVTADHLAAHQSSPNEGFDVVDPSRLATATRGHPTAVESALRPGAARKALGALRLDVATAKSRYVVGEPVTLTVELVNDSESTVAVPPLLDPSYRFLQVFVRGPGDPAPRPFRPLALRDSRGAKDVEIPAKQSFVEESKVFFGAEGWTFARAGEYVLTAEFQLPNATQDARLLSNEVKLVIAEPESAADRAGSSRLRTSSGELDHQAGLYLLFEGGDHLNEGAERVRQVARDASGSAHAAAAKLALGVAALHPTIERGARVAPVARLDEAKELLAGLLDSDLAAPTVARASEQLARALDAADRKVEASDVRRRANERFQGSKIKAMLERLRRKE
jgi:hypothetical protein